MQNNTSRLIGAVDNLLTTARIESGSLYLTDRPGGGTVVSFSLPKKLIA